MSVTPPTHWHVTDDDEVMIPVRDASSEEKIPFARRTPAALIGIVLFATIGISIAQGWQVLLGQAGTTSPDVRITDQGTEPETLTVVPGQHVLFRNDSTIPQILLFETLIDETGISLETSAIFPESEAQVLIPYNTPEGTYPYFSSTSVTVSGSLIVSLTAVQQSIASVQSSSPASATVQPLSSSSASVVVSVARSIASSSTSNDVPQTAEPLATSIPVNPYAVDAETVPEFRKQPMATATPDIITHMPQETAESGIALWTTLVLIAVSCMAVMRKASV